MPPFACRRRFRLMLRGRELELGPRTLLMGILNLTPDSFSDGGRFAEAAAAVDRAWRIAEEGADILDIGGESSRPGSRRIGVEEELRRVVPVLEALAGSYPIPISIDTRRAEVAGAALERGAALVNDITALRSGPGLAALIAGHDAGIVLMHMRGEPETMQENPAAGNNIVEEIRSWAEEAIERAENYGVSCEKIILDPGIGFGKTTGQNLGIIQNLNTLAQIGFPLLLGTSRKSFIGEVLGRAVEDRVWGTAATVACSILSGAHMVRVHDVASMKDVARMTDAVLNERSEE